MEWLILAPPFTIESRRVSLFLVRFLSGRGYVASTQLRLFASPIFPGGLSPACALSMCRGSYYDGHVQRGQRADPNSPGLEGMTSLMHMINQGSAKHLQTQ